MSRMKVYNLATATWEYMAAVAPVSVGPSAPPSPVDGQLWWDNDDVEPVQSNFSTTALANDAAFTGKYAPISLGVKAYSQTNVAQNGLGVGPTIMNNLAASFTAVTGRLYKVSYGVSVRQQTSTGLVTLQTYETVVGVGTILHYEFKRVGAPDYEYFHGFFYHTPAAGTRTYRIQVGTSAGSLDVNALGYSQLIVEDIGAV